MTISHLFRPHIRAITPYSSARDEYKGEAKVFLDANESPFDNGMNRYPDPKHLALREAIVAFRGLSVQKVFVGHGSDEIIDLLIRIFCTPGKDQILVLPPTYGMYAVCAKGHDVSVLSVPLIAEGSPNIAQIKNDGLTPAITFVCRPNNPTGWSMTLAEVMQLLESIDGILVVDEAYIDFAQSDSLCDLISAEPRLVVIQTLSKAFGAASLRIGWALAHEEIVSALYTIKLPYNIGAEEQHKAILLIHEAAKLKSQVEIICSQRKLITQKLQGLEIVEKVFPSEANFLLVRFRHAKKVYDYLLKHGIVVRDRTLEPGCEECLRISIGTPEENNQLIQTLSKYDEESIVY